MCFGSNEPLPETAPDTDWICFYVDRSDQHLCAVFHVQVNNYNIYDVGILFVFTYKLQKWYFSWKRWQLVRKQVSGGHMWPRALVSEGGVQKDQWAANGIE